MYTLWNGLKCKYTHSIHTHTVLHHPSPPQAPPLPPPQARHLHPPPCCSPLWPFPTHHQTTAGESELTQTEVRLSAACHAIVPEQLIQRTQFTILCDEYEPNSSWLQYVYCFILFSCSCYCIVNIDCFFGRSNSTGSMTSLISGSESSSISQEDSIPRLEAFVETFLIALVILNCKRKQKPSSLSLWVLSVGKLL